MAATRGGSAGAVESMRDDPGAWGEPVKPRKSEQRQRSAMVSVRFTPDEVAVVQERAGGMPVSTYLRELALAIDDASELREWRGQ